MPKSYVSAHQRMIVIQRACGCCEYCRAQETYAPDPFSVEHIIPTTKGGTNALTNLAYACQGCNGRKYVSTEAIDPGSGDMVPLYHPRRDQWADHFAWNEDCTLIIGLTPIGRATVEKLQLNRVGLANLRRILYRLDAHPPEC